MTDRNKVDIKENDVLRYDRQLFTILLKDNSTKQNIIWATDNYVPYGPDYFANEQIAIPLISGKNGNIIKPRVEKNKKEQIARVRDKAEVFTPSWICNKQNNLVDKAWFGADNIFSIVPNQDFTKSWTDAELNAKYGLTDDEIVFIDSTIKPMK